MDISTAVSWITAHAVVAIVLGGAAIAILSVFIQSGGVYAWYVIVLAGALAFAALKENWLYFWAFFLGTLTAFTEIIGKFRDEPLKSFRTKEALFYHAFNGLVAAFALYVLTISGTPEGPMEHIKVVLAAGLGSMLIMRSKLFNLKVGNEDVSFGPEQFVKVFFRFMEQAIDRVRGQARIDFINATMDDIDCEMYAPYIRTMLEASQLLGEDKRKALDAEIQKICDSKAEDKQIRSYHLGFVLLNEMGEEFVSKVFSDRKWTIKAPTRTAAGAWLPFLGQKEEYVQYFAYGRDLSTQILIRRLGWSQEDVKRVWSDANPGKGKLERFRLVFGKPAEEDPLNQGFATIVPDPAGVVEGVVYRLPAGAAKFLDNFNMGYQRIPREVIGEDGKAIAAQVYISEARPGLKPTREYLDTLLAAAEEHGLSAEYVNVLRQTEALTSGPSAKGEGTPAQTGRTSQSQPEGEHEALLRPTISLDTSRGESMPL